MGGQSVTLEDDEAKRRGSKKTVPRPERVPECYFDYSAVGRANTYVLSYSHLYRMARATASVALVWVDRFTPM